MFTPRRQSGCGIGGWWDAPPSPCGEGQSGFDGSSPQKTFQSTLPVWGGTLFFIATTNSCEFQSTLPVWGGTTPWQQSERFSSISIHPPRVGRDRKSAAGPTIKPYFNPPSPCVEGPGSRSSSTLPKIISIHPPRMGRDRSIVERDKAAWISIHPPRMGRDPPPGDHAA